MNKKETRGKIANEPTPQSIQERDGEREKRNTNEWYGKENHCFRACEQGLDTEDVQFTSG